MAKHHSRPRPVGGMTDDHTWSKSVWTPQIPDEFLVDEDGLSKELAIEKRATDAGVAGLPRKSDTILDETQRKICDRIFKGILLLNQFLAEQLGAVVAAARENRIHPRDPEGLQDEIQLRVDGAISEGRAELEKLGVDRARKGRELRAFARTNRRLQGAHYPDSLALPVAIIFGMLVGESILNGSLFQAVMPNGLAGAFVLAFVISAINIMLGLAGGLYGWRNLKHRQVGNRILGVLVTIIALGGGIAWNFMVAHFREAAALQLGNADFDFDLTALSRATLDHLAANGLLGIGSVEAWALLLIGLAIHLYTSKKGWEDLTDRYPDYMKVDVRLRRAEQAYDDHLAGLRFSARASVEALEAEAVADAGAAQAWLDEIDDLIDRAQQRCEEVMGSEDIWVATGNRFLKLYRDVNTEIQSERTVPAYFKTYPTAEDYRTRAFGGVRRDGKVEAQATLIQRCMAELKRLRDEGKSTLDAAKLRARDIHRHVNAAVRALDGALAEVEAVAATKANAILDHERDTDPQSPHIDASR